MLDYLIGAMRRAGKLPEHPYFLKTIVTTEMACQVAESHDVTCYDTFTGFKFMAEKKNALEAADEGHVIMSYEESYGYMLGDYVRDKDAVTASLLITEMAAWYAAQGHDPKQYHRPQIHGRSGIVIGNEQVNGIVSIDNSGVELHGISILIGILLILAAKPCRNRCTGYHCDCTQHWSEPYT